jgi:hypothetical protein
MPSIAFFKSKVKGPRILVCRYHSSRDHFKYLHCLTNPVGTISFTGNNALSQVVAVPRTMQTFKAHKYGRTNGQGTFRCQDRCNKKYMLSVCKNIGGRHLSVCQLIYVMM